ncbi:MAG: hypothetical protein KDK01_15830, partial [Rhodobacteraceae bacterium]|nr:hypothetical protein [Paracoccaceae bacterium]
NHRHEDFQSGAIQGNASTYGITARQTPDGGSNTYAENVKPARADLTNENPGATAIATGAKDVVEGVCSLTEYTALFPILAMHWGALV